MKRTENRGSPSGLGVPGSHPAPLFIENGDMDLTPQESRFLEPKDSISTQTGMTGTVTPSPHIISTANSGQTENPLILSALPTGGMKSPCTSAESVYQNRETFQERNEWLEAIARDDRRLNG